MRQLLPVSFAPKGIHQRHHPPFSVVRVDPFMDDDEGKLTFAEETVFFARSFECSGIFLAFDTVGPSYIVSFVGLGFNFSYGGVNIRRTLLDYHLVQ